MSIDAFGLYHATCRDCEEPSEEAIHAFVLAEQWIASLRSQ